LLGPIESLRGGVCLTIMPAVREYAKFVEVGSQPVRFEQARFESNPAVEDYEEIRDWAFVVCIGC